MFHIFIYTPRFGVSKGPSLDTDIINYFSLKFPSKKNIVCGCRFFFSSECEKIDICTNFELRLLLLTSCLNSSYLNFKIVETFSIRFFMGNRKPQNVTWPQPCGHVCSLQFTFEPQEGLPAVSDLLQGFLPLKIVQPCV